MNQFFRAVFIGFVGAAIVASCTQAFSQTTTTLGGLTTVTNGNVTSTSVTHLNISGSDRKIQMGELSKVVLNNLTLSPGLAFTGSSLQFTGVTSLTFAGSGLSLSGTQGALTLSNTGLVSATSGAATIFTITTGAGTLTGAQTTTGVLTLSNLGLGSAATTTSALYVNTTTSGRSGIRIQTVANQTVPHLEFYNSAGVQLGYFDPIYGLQIRHASTTNMISVGTAGQQMWGINTSATSAYQQVVNTAGVAFAAGTVITGTSVSVNSQTSGILQVTDTNYARSTLAMGSIGLGYRATATNGSLTTTDGILNVTASSVTQSLADATTLTGRMTIIINSSAGTSTVQGMTTTQTLNGATTMSIGANGSLRLISTGTVWLSY